MQSLISKREHIYRTTLSGCKKECSQYWLRSQRDSSLHSFPSQKGKLSIVVESQCNLMKLYLYWSLAVCVADYTR